MAAPRKKKKSKGSRASRRARARKAKQELQTKEIEIARSLLEVQEKEKNAEVEIEWLDPTQKDEESVESHALPPEVIAVVPSKPSIMEEEDEEEGVPESHKQRKKRLRPTSAQLKLIVDYPELVQFHDCNSPEPELLIQMKGTKHSVPVPPHWDSKSKYLQRQKSSEAGPFQLPKFIKDTGIQMLRSAELQRQSEMSTKAKARERLMPKLNRMDIDYTVLHDAFFKHQTKPRMTIHGDLFYQGRENEIRRNHFKPGVISEGLREALGMVSDTTPPPWLINMQRFGPPPSYPDLDIPGLNAPLPPGCKYGFGMGEWGKPPTDRYGNPLYGDPYGVKGAADAVNVKQGDTDTLFGTIEAEEDSEDEDSSEEEVVEFDPLKNVGIQQPVQDEKEELSDNISTVTQDTTATGTTLNLPTYFLFVLIRMDASVDIRKGTYYQVLEEKKASVGSGMFGTDHTYVVPGEKDTLLGKRKNPEPAES